MVSPTLMKMMATIVVWILSCGGDPETDLPADHAPPLDELPVQAPPTPINAWLQSHFDSPVDPQGPVPETYEGATSGLLPEDCGSCHVSQYEDWQTSWHAMGMGPGIMGQLVHLDGEDDRQVARCNRCHAPLSEQAPRILVDPSSDGEWTDNPNYMEAQRELGLTCVGCHVRAHERFGPDGATVDAGVLPHGGATAREEFRSPAFCRTCHDFDDRPRIGVQFENTADSDVGVLLSGVSEGAAAYSAGVRTGDRIVAIDGETVHTGEDIRNHVVLAGATNPMLVRLIRNGEYLSLEMTPEATRSRPEGKLLQETTEEWRRTRFAAEGTTCQDCHMPEGRHLWRGIHDPDMVRQGLGVAANIVGVRDAMGLWARLWGTREVVATLTATNIGAGHRLPTYTTPEIHLIMEQLDADGSTIAGTRQQTTIARRMRPDLSEEIYDTRLMPDESLVLEYVQNLHGRATAIRAWVEVWPDEAYRRNYDNWLANDRFPTGEHLLQEARQASIDSRYVLWTDTLAF